MSTAIKKLDGDVLRILGTATIEGTHLRMPKIDDPKLYKRVAQFFKDIGGPWKGGKTQAHVFDYDPTDAIENAIMTGVYTREKIDYQFFESPEPVASFLAVRGALGDLKPGARIYEPQAGNGAVAREIRARMPAGVSLFVNDLNPKCREALAAQGFDLLGENDPDFLGQTFPDPPGGGRLARFDRIIQNPPFWKRLDARCVLHAFEEGLAEGGRLVSVMGANMRWRTDRDYAMVRLLVSERGGVIEDLPPGSFRASGTDVSAVVVTVDK